MMKQTLWAFLVLAACACTPSASQDADARVDLLSDNPGTWTCPAEWETVSAIRGERCEPPALSTTCSEGSFALPDGTCTLRWTCPDGWTRTESGWGCEPPILEPDCPEGSFARATGGCADAWVCPAGWTRVEGDFGCTVQYDACSGPDERPLAGGGCEVLPFDACGSSPWGDAVWPAETLYVDAGSISLSPDGSQSEPFATLQDAIAVPGGGSSKVIALAKGSYDAGVVRVSGDVRIGGACAAEVDVVGEFSLKQGAGTVNLHDFRLHGGDVGIVAEEGRLELERMIVEDARQGALSILGVEVTASDVRVGPTGGVGIAIFDDVLGLVERKGDVRCERCLIVGAVGAGVTTNDQESEIELVDTTVSDCGFRGLAIVGRASLTDVLLDGHGRTALHVEAEDSLVVAERVVIRDTRPTSTGEHGEGLTAKGSRVELRDVVLTGNSGVGAYIQAKVELREERLARSEMLWERVVIEDTQSNVAGLGVGLWIEGSLLDVEHLWVRANHTAGVIIDEDVDQGFVEISEANLRHVVVESTRPNSEGKFGAGVIVQNNAKALFDTALIRDNRSTGLQLNSGGQGVFNDVRIEETQTTPGSREPGFGVTVHRAALMVGADVRIVGNDAAALTAANSGSRAQLTRFFVDDVRGPDPDELNRAFQVSDGAALELRDGLTQSSRLGIVAFGDSGPTTISATRVLLREHGPVDGDTTGVGVGIYGELSTMMLEDVVIERNKDIGAALLSMKRFDATRLVVLDTRIAQGAAGLDAADGLGALFKGGSYTLTQSWIRGSEGPGVVVASGAALEALNFRVEGNNSTGLYVSEESSVVLEDTLIHKNREAGLLLETSSFASVERLVLADTEASAAGLGDGLLLRSGATLEARDVVARDNARSGLVIESASGTLSGGHITRNGTGLVLQLEATYKAEGVFIEDNEQDDERCASICLDAPSIITPVDPLAPIE